MYVSLYWIFSLTLLFTVQRKVTIILVQVLRGHNLTQQSHQNNHEHPLNDRIRTPITKHQQWNSNPDKYSPYLNFSILKPLGCLTRQT